MYKVVSFSQSVHALCKTGTDSHISIVSTRSEAETIADTLNAYNLNSAIVPCCECGTKVVFIPERYLCQKCFNKKISAAVSITDLEITNCPECKGKGQHESFGMPELPCGTCNGYGRIWKKR